MCVSEWLKRDEFYTRNDIGITGIDISNRVLDHARRAIYADSRFGRSLEQQYLDSYFENTTAGKILRPQIRAMVSFEKVNLAEQFELPGPFDIIFCRNVMIYFAAELKTLVVERLYEMLRSGGVLFLGASESMYPFSERFRTVHTDETTYYVRA